MVIFTIVIGPSGKNHKIKMDKILFKKLRDKTKKKRYLAI